LITSLLTSVPAVRVSLTPLEQHIDLGTSEERMILIGTRGPIHVCQIRRPPVGRYQDMDVQLLRQRDRRPANADNARGTL
jgi:hypothetical protein